MGVQGGRQATLSGGRPSIGPIGALEAATPPSLPAGCSAHLAHHRHHRPILRRRARWPSEAQRSAPTRGCGHRRRHRRRRRRRRRRDPEREKARKTHWARVSCRRRRQSSSPDDDDDDNDDDGDDDEATAVAECAAIDVDVFRRRCSRSGARRSCAGRGGFRRCTRGLWQRLAVGRRGRRR